MRDHFLPFLLLVLSLTILCGCKNENAPPAVRIAYLPITHALPVLVEKELHTDPAFSVELVRYGSWPELMDALNTGRVDGASALTVLAVAAREQGIPLRMVALGHRGGNVIVAGKHIATAADLKGRTVAVPHRQSSHHLLVRLMLEKADLRGVIGTEKNLDADAVRLIELSPPEMPAALARGDIDAYCVAEPYGAQALALGAGKVLYHSDELWPDSLCCALVFNEQFLARNPEAARRYTAAYLKAGSTMDADQNLTSRVAARELKVNGDVLAMSLDWIAFAKLAIRPEDYARLTELMVRYGLTQKPPTFDGVVTTP